MKGLKLVGLSALLCGCSPIQWVRQNTTPEQTQLDGAECRIAAYGNYPYKELVVEHAHSATTTEDANQMIREADAAYCLQAKGYNFERAK
jgi:hypothetical protein